MDLTISKILHPFLPEPIPTSWFDLPLEMREIVIDEMDPKTRCIFAQCSKLCEKEAKRSRNYLYEVSINYPNTIEAAHTEKRNYKLTFLEIDEERTLVIYVAYINGDRANRDVKWTKVEYGHPSEVRSKYFKEFIENYGHSINYLKIIDKTFFPMNQNLKLIKSIHGIIIDCEDVFERGYLNPKQLINTDVVSLDQTNFTFEEIVSFRGETYSVKSDDFNEEKIIKYLKMWKNGKLSYYLAHLFVRIPFELDMQNIIKEFDVFDYKENGNKWMFQFYANHQTDNKITQVNYNFPNLGISFYEEVDEDEDNEEYEENEGSEDDE